MPLTPAYNLSPQKFQLPFACAFYDCGFTIPTNKSGTMSTSQITSKSNVLPFSKPVVTEDLIYCKWYDLMNCLHAVRLGKYA